MLPSTLDGRVLSELRRMAAIGFLPATDRISAKAALQSRRRKSVESLGGGYQRFSRIVRSARRRADSLRFQPAPIGEPTFTLIELTKVQRIRASPEQIDPPGPKTLAGKRRCSSRKRRIRLRLVRIGVYLREQTRSTGNEGGAK